MLKKDKTMTWKKITYGWVTQTYKDNVCIEQDFFAGDEVQAEDMDGEPIDHPREEQYQPFDMIQPYPGGSKNAPNVTL